MAYPQLLAYDKVKRVYVSWWYVTEKKTVRIPIPTLAREPFPE